MPIESPQLDDLRYDRVKEELVRRIPVYTKDWTDYNDSDPGVTLIQLFAHLAEQVGYRLNRVPEKNHVELLKLLGVRLEPAHAATSRLALLLSDPATLTGYTFGAGGTARAKKGSPPSAFETDADVDVVPAEPVLLLTTKNPDLRDLLLKPGKAPKDANAYDSAPADPSVVTDPHLATLTLTWDGKAPKLKDMPTDPVTLAPDTDQRHLWVGVNYNDARDAGFRGVRVTLTVQLDDDEQPTLTAAPECGPDTPGAEPAVTVDWLWYYDAQEPDPNKKLKAVTGRIDDTTGHLTRSGTIRFTVPFSIGPIPAAEFKDLRAVPAPESPVAACLDLADQIKMSVPAPNVDPSGTADAVAQALATWVGKYGENLEAAITAVKADANKPADKPIPHPLDVKYRGTKGWFRIDLSAATDGPPAAVKLRMVTFNAVAVTNATTVTGELLGVADGRPGQAFSLSHGNVQPGTLALAVQESADAGQPLKSWDVVDSLDAAGAFDRQAALDPEAGQIQFGDGEHGMIAPLVPGAGRVVALRYRWGGGLSGEVDAGAITALATPGPGIAGVVNFVAARGGKDAETLEQAKVRARKELSTRSRAVTAGDFAWIATRTPDVRVARAHVVPLRGPLAPGSQVIPVAKVPCGAPLPVGPRGSRRRSRRAWFRSWSSPTCPAPSRCRPRRSSGPFAGGSTRTAWSRPRCTSCRRSTCVCATSTSWSRARPATPAPPSRTRSPPGSRPTCTS